MVACPRTRRSWIRMGDAPPAPSPPPSPSKTPTFWALWSVSRMGGAEVKGEIAGAITPTSIPLPPALFSSGRARRRGIKVGPTMFLHLDPPRPLPCPHSSATGAPIAPVAPLRGQGGGQVRGNNSHPTTHVLLMQPPLLPSPPLPDSGDLGNGGLVTTLHPYLPHRSQGLGLQFYGRRPGHLAERWGRWGGGLPELSCTPRVSCRACPGNAIPPPDPPPPPASSCTRFLDIPSAGHPEIRWRMTQAGGGSGCPALRWAGEIGFLWPPCLPRMRDLLRK